MSETHEVRDIGWSEGPWESRVESEGPCELRREGQPEGLGEIEPEVYLMGREWKRDEDRRRRPGAADRAVNAKKLWEQHSTVLDYVAAGFTNVETAAITGVTPMTVSNLRNCELGQEKLRVLSAIRNKHSVDVMKEVAEMLPHALAVYDEILRNEDVSLKLKKETADTLLCRISGYEAAKKLDVRSLSLTGADLAELKERGRAAARAQGIVIESIREEGGDG